MPTVTARAADGEGPVHEVELDAFSIDATSVTNDDFAGFVAATGYRTEAETFASQPSSIWPWPPTGPT